MQAISLSPSFSSYSNTKFAEIADRIVGEFDTDEFSDDFYFESRENSAAQRGEVEVDFEFVTLGKDSELSSQTSADEIFRNGKIQPVYPVFNRDLLLRHREFQSENWKENGVGNLVPPKIRLPLRKLFHEERETRITTTEIYCVWPPIAEDDRCKKSNSTGCDSKRWKLRDFLHRSQRNNKRLVIEKPADGGEVEPAALLSGR